MHTISMVNNLWHYAIKMTKSTVRIIQAVSFISGFKYLHFKLLCFQISKRSSRIPTVINGSLSIYISKEIE